MIKVPATEAGIPAIEELTALGVNVNITLLFSVARYEQVIDAYMAGLERRLAAGQPVDSIMSVASFFVSRVDTKADAVLPAGSALRGRVAVANAQRAYAHYRRRFATERWGVLRDAGANAQRPLWASTGTKDPAYSDVLYVEALIAPDVVNTMPEATLREFADHGAIGPPLNADASAAEQTLRDAETAGIDLDSLTAELEHDGRALVLRLLPAADRLHRDQALRMTERSRQRAATALLQASAMSWSRRYFRTVGSCETRCCSSSPVHWHMSTIAYRCEISTTRQVAPKATQRSSSSTVSGCTTFTLPISCETVPRRHGGDSVQGCAPALADRLDDVHRPQTVGRALREQQAAPEC